MSKSRKKIHKWFEMNIESPREFLRYISRQREDKRRSSQEMIWCLIALDIRLQELITGE